MFTVPAMVTVTIVTSATNSEYMGHSAMVTATIVTSATNSEYMGHSALWLLLQY